MTTSFTPSKPPSFDLPDLAPLAESLHAAAQALLALSRTGRPPGSGVAAEENQPVPGKMPDVFRSYRLPGFMVDEELKMLDKFGAEDWQGLLHLARSRFEAVVSLMRQCDDSWETDGFFLGQIAEHLLEPPLDMLHKLCSLAADLRPFEEEDAG